MSIDDDVAGAPSYPGPATGRPPRAPEGWSQERQRLIAAVERLRRHNDQLQVALRHRSVLEQAKGILAARYGLTPDAAFDVLSKASQDHNLKAVQVAGSIVADVTGASPVPPGGDADAAPSAEGGADATRTARMAAQAAFAAAEREGGATASAVVRPRPGLAGDAVTERAWFEAAAAGLEAAGTVDELLLAAVRECRWPDGCDRGVFMLLEPDGSLRMAAGHGMPGDVMSQWVRIPPAVDFPAVRVALTGEPYWASDLAQSIKDFALFAEYPISTPSYANIPLRRDGATVGVLGLGWPRRVTFDEDRRRFLLEYAAQIARRLDTLLGDLSAASIDRVSIAPAPGDALPAVPGGGPRPDGDDGDHRRLVITALNASAAPVIVLRPVLRSGPGTGGDRGVELTDLVVRWVNEAGVAELGRPLPDLTGRSLLELFPGAAGAPWWPALEAAVRLGRSERVVALDATPDDRVPARAATITRLWDGVTVSWTAVPAGA